MAQRAGPRKVKRGERLISIIELRISGLTYEEIGRKLGVSRQRAHQLVMKAIAEQQRELDEDVKRLVHIELRRVEAIISQLWPRRYDPRVADSILRAIERRAKLAGLDAPERRELSGPGGTPLGLEVRFVEPPHS